MGYCLCSFCTTILCHPLHSRRLHPKDEKPQYKEIATNVIQTSLLFYLYLYMLHENWFYCFVSQEMYLSLQVYKHMMKTRILRRTFSCLQCFSTETEQKAHTRHYFLKVVTCPHPQQLFESFMTLTVRKKKDPDRCALEIYTQHSWSAGMPGGSTTEKLMNTQPRLCSCALK